MIIWFSIIFLQIWKISFINKIPIWKYIIRADFVGYNTIKKDIYISIKDAEDFEDEPSSFNETDLAD